MARLIRTLAERFWEKVAVTADPWDCWLWQACVDEHGYGVLARPPGDKGSRGAHLIAWELFGNRVPGGLVLAHLCDTPACVNTVHLMPDTYTGNLIQRYQRQTRSTVDLNIIRKPHPPRVERICPTCGIFFTAQAGRAARGLDRFCSHSCVHKPLADRFWEKVDKSGDCWLWTAATNGKYGVIGLGGKGDGMDTAHRVSWRLHFGSIPDGLKVCHDCPGGDNPLCVRPDHLRVDTQAGNLADMRRKGRQGRTGPRGSGQLNPIAVMVMRYLHWHCGYSVVRLACAHEVNYYTAQRAVRGFSWKEVPFP